jgi:hypothetical protein
LILISAFMHYLHFPFYGSSLFWHFKQALDSFIYIQYILYWPRRPLLILQEMYQHYTSLSLSEKPIGSEEEQQPLKPSELVAHSTKVFKQVQHCFHIGVNLNVWRNLFNVMFQCFDCQTLAPDFVLNLRIK